MLIRYKKGADGLDAVARVYSKDENRIDPELVDRDAVSVIRRLNDSGFESYLVGGAVRDLLLGRIPKDFDVATAASPRQVHKLFYNSRVIGRRFKIVHITFGKKIIEVSTFRSTRDHEYSDDNQYGTIEEDCTRRDFTINSLYYDPIKGCLIDFNNALSDFEHKRIVSLIPLNRTFVEDPVRMVRAVKYSVTTGFRIPMKLAFAIRHYAPQIAGVSTSRMTEEVNKILACGNSCEIFRRLNSFKLLVYILPAISVYASFPQMFESLKKLDDMVNEKKGNPKAPAISKAQMYLSLVQPFLTRNPELVNPSDIFHDVLRQIKVLISPITPPNYELESAAALYLISNGIRVPKGAIKHRNPDSAAPKNGPKAKGNRPTQAKEQPSNDANGEVKRKRKRRRKKKKPNAQATLQNQAKTEHKE